MKYPIIQKKLCIIGFLFGERLDKTDIRYLTFNLTKNVREMSVVEGFGTVGAQ